MEAEIENNEQVILASAELSSKVRTLLHNSFPRSTPLSILLLHISQLEQLSFAAQSTILHKRQRYHAPASFLEQVLVNVQRAIRASDQILRHEGTGAAIIFPHVDQQGAYSILERIYRNVSLLQAETVIPPLSCETNILMGIGSYPEPGASVEQMLSHVGGIARRLTLRPAITPQMWRVEPRAAAEETAGNSSQDGADHFTQSNYYATVPFMQLPAQLPTRLKNLIPYHLALELHCAPVGRDHHCLTVAMADPTNAKSLQHLREVTGMTIFPVACEIPALNILLLEKW